MKRKIADAACLSMSPDAEPVSVNDMHEGMRRVPAAGITN
ncbi:Hypothetical protein BIBO2_2538 [Brucella sp. BO2]|nr:Hypothetical protein BIBO1_0198 [Brucella inopinata BO1]EFM58611.1 Hypothetical protein BIBO2_2538 [Brucella sp. BO2]